MKIVKNKIVSFWIEDFTDLEISYQRKIKRHFFTRRILSEVILYSVGYGLVCPKDKYLDKFPNHIIKDNNYVYRKPRVVIHYQDNKYKYVYCDSMEEAKKWKKDNLSDINTIKI